MKVAFIGNMNNNNFSLMRYFRDLGVDAHLLLWKNDGVGGLSHFTPESDSWNIKIWEKYIHQTHLENAFTHVIGDPRKLTLPLSTTQIKKEINGYDMYIGSGLAPALLIRAGVRLDIFYPYSTGVEYVGITPSGKSIDEESLVRRMFLKILRSKQVEGILKARYCLNAELGPTQRTLDAIGRKTEYLPIPMVYNKETLPQNVLLPERLRELQAKIEQADLSIFSHSRQLWKSKAGYNDADWSGMNKNNDWLIRGFSKLLQARSHANPLLIMLEYGPDVSFSKSLCDELGVSKNVIWLSLMKRKEIMFVLSLVNIGVGEFTVFPGCIWGGSGWEVLAAGKPLLQAFNFTDADYKSKYGISPPNILDVKSEDDVFNHLCNWYQNRNTLIKQGDENKEWFDRNGGIGLAKKWLSLLS